MSGPPDADAQSGRLLALTIYADDLALVHERRSVTLERGDNRLVVDIGRGAVPASALVTAGAGATVRDLTHEPGRLSPATLLESAIGREVTLVRVNPVTGVETRERAEILAVQDGVVLRVGDRVETDIAGRLVFDAVPTGLQGRPALLARIDADAAGRREVEVSYLTSGLSWRADYVARVTGDGGRLDMEGWATITNGSGADYADAALHLVAGRVNRAMPPTQPRLRSMEMMAGAAADLAEEPMLGGRLYSLPGRTSLGDGEMKMLPLLSATAVRMDVEYVAEAPPRLFVGTALSVPAENPAVVLRIDNDEQRGLGRMLPAGIVRVYRPSDQGALVFQGEDHIGHTPPGQEVRLHLARDVDISIRREQTAFQRIADDIHEAAWTVTIANAKTQAVMVRLEDHFPGDWRILSESLAHEKKSADTAVWRLTVPAGGETKLHYRVRVRV